MHKLIARPMLDAPKCKSKAGKVRRANEPQIDAIIFSTFHMVKIENCFKYAYKIIETAEIINFEGTFLRCAGDILRNSSSDQSLKWWSRLQFAQRGKNFNQQIDSKKFIELLAASETCIRLGGFMEFVNNVACWKWNFVFTEVEDRCKSSLFIAKFT